MAREIVNRFSDFTVDTGPVIDVVNKIVLNDAAGASSVFKVFDPSKDEVITITEASGQTVISVSNSGKFVIADKLEMTLDDDTIHLAAVISIQTEDGTITIDTAIIDSMAAGNRVRVIMGVVIAMVEHGIADLDTDDWGYIGTFPDNHISHFDSRSKAGFDLDIEVQFDGGAGLAAVETHCITIQEKICDV